jgi:hypothetical protein
MKKREKGERRKSGKEEEGEKMAEKRGKNRARSGKKQKG